MKIQIVFVGFSEACIKSALKIGGDKIIALHSGNKKSEPWVNELKKQFGADDFLIEPYDVLKQEECLIKLYNKFGVGNEFIVNLTGATKFGMLACFVFSYYLHTIKPYNLKEENSGIVRFVYLEETTGNISEFPLNYYFDLNKTIIKVYGLGEINERGKKPKLKLGILQKIVEKGTVELMELTKIMKKSKATITVALKDWIAGGLIKARRNKVKVEYLIEPRTASFIKAILDITERKTKN